MYNFAVTKRTKMEKVNLQRINEHNVASYLDNEIALFDKMSDIGTIPSEKMLLEGFIFAFIVRGNASATIDDTCYDLHEGDVFICYPKNILEGFMMSIDFECRAAFVTPELAEKLASMVNLDWIFRIMAQSHEITHASPENIRHFTAYFDLFRGKLTLPDSPNKQNSLNMLFASLIYEFLDIRAGSSEGITAQTFSTSENLVQRFFHLLADTDHPYASVKRYADQLNVTPKYFSAVCKRLTGKTASRIIDEAVIKSAQILLHDNSKSIKQIADQLGFDNQSHFGTYFKHHVGISPQQFRIVTHLL